MERSAAHSSLFVVPAKTSFHKPVAISTTGSTPSSGTSSAASSSRTAHHAGSRPSLSRKASSIHRDRRRNSSKGTRVEATPSLKARKSLTQLQKAKSSETINPKPHGRKPTISRPKPLPSQSPQRLRPTASRKEIPPMPLRPRVATDRNGCGVGGTVRSSSSVPLFRQGSQVPTIPSRDVSMRNVSVSSTRKQSGVSSRSLLVPTKSPNPQRIRLRVKSDSGLIEPTPKEVAPFPPLQEPRRSSTHFPSARTSNAPQRETISERHSEHLFACDGGQRSIRGFTEKPEHHSTYKEVNICTSTQPTSPTIIVTADSDVTLHRDSSALQARSVKRASMQQNPNRGIAGDSWPFIPTIPDEEPSTPVNEDEWKDTVKLSESPRRTTQSSSCAISDWYDKEWLAGDTTLEGGSYSGSMKDDGDSRTLSIKPSVGSLDEISQQDEVLGSPISIVESNETTSSCLTPSVIPASATQTHERAPSRNGLQAVFATIGKKVKQSRQTLHLGSWLQRLHLQEQAKDPDVQENTKKNPIWKGSLRIKRSTL